MENINCNHCGKIIENDSNFCTFCGEKIIKNVQEIKNQVSREDQIDNVGMKDENPKSLNNDNGYFIVGFVFFGIQILRPVLYFYMLGQTGINYTYSYLIFGADIVFAGIPILLSRYTKEKNHKKMLIIMGIITMFLALKNDSNPYINF
jgi:hypothetical protein